MALRIVTFVGDLTVALLVFLAIVGTWRAGGDAAALVLVAVLLAWQLSSLQARLRRWSAQRDEAGDTASPIRTDERNHP